MSVVKCVSRKKVINDLLSTHGISDDNRSLSDWHISLHKFASNTITDSCTDVTSFTDSSCKNSIVTKIIQSVKHIYKEECNKVFLKILINDIKHCRSSDSGAIKLTESNPLDRSLPANESHQTERNISDIMYNTTEEIEPSPASHNYGHHIETVANSLPNHNSAVEFNEANNYQPSLLSIKVRTATPLNLPMADDTCTYSNIPQPVFCPISNPYVELSESSSEELILAHEGDYLCDANERSSSSIDFVINREPYDIPSEDSFVQEVIICDSRQRYCDNTKSSDFCFEEVVDSKEIVQSKTSNFIRSPTTSKSLSLSKSKSKSLSKNKSESRSRSKNKSGSRSESRSKSRSRSRSKNKSESRSRSKSKGKSSKMSLLKVNMKENEKSERSAYDEMDVTPSSLFEISDPFTNESSLSSHPVSEIAENSTSLKKNSRITFLFKDIGLRALTDQLENDLDLIEEERIRNKYKQPLTDKQLSNLRWMDKCEGYSSSSSATGISSSISSLEIEDKSQSEKERILEKKYQCKLCCSSVSDENVLAKVSDLEKLFKPNQVEEREACTNELETSGWIYVCKLCLEKSEVKSQWGRPPPCEPLVEENHTKSSLPANDKSKSGYPSVAGSFRESPSAINRNTAEKISAYGSSVEPDQTRPRSKSLGSLSEAGRRASRRTISFRQSCEMGRRASRRTTSARQSREMERLSSRRTTNSALSLDRTSSSLISLSESKVKRTASKAETKRYDLRISQSENEADKREPTSIKQRTSSRASCNRGSIVSRLYMKSSRRSTIHQPDLVEKFTKEKKFSSKAVPRYYMKKFNYKFKTNPVEFNFVLYTPVAGSDRVLTPFVQTMTYRDKLNDKNVEEFFRQCRSEFYDRRLYGIEQKTHTKFILHYKRHCVEHANSLVQCEYAYPGSIIADHEHNIFRALCYVENLLPEIMARMEFHSRLNGNRNFNIFRWPQIQNFIVRNYQKYRRRGEKSIFGNETPRDNDEMNRYDYWIRKHELYMNNYLQNYEASNNYLKEFHRQGNCYIDPNLDSKESQWDTNNSCLEARHASSCCNKDFMKKKLKILYTWDTARLFRTSNTGLYAGKCINKLEEKFELKFGPCSIRKHKKCDTLKMLQVDVQFKHKEDIVKLKKYIRKYLDKKR